MNLKNYLKNIENKTLVTVFPHPDDETIPTGGLLLEAKKLGWETIVICLTKGEKGKISFETNKNTRDIRVNELKNALEILEVSKYHILEFEDSKIREFQDEVESKLTKLLKDINPGVVVTYDPSGTTGHPDHITSTLLVRKILKEHKLQSKLIWVAFEGLPKLFHHTSSTLKYFTKPNAYLRLSFGSKIKKARAFLKHKSQIPDFSRKVTFVFYCLVFKERFHLVDENKEYEFEYVEYEI